MDIKILITILTVTCKGISAQDNQNKTKRGLTDQTYDYGIQNPHRPLQYYNPDTAVAPTQILNTPSFEPPKYSQPITEPKVASQQVLYEYQQTPHNTVSNVHVNQQFQNAADNANTRTTTPYVQYQTPPVSMYHQPVPQFAETVVNPVQHSALIHHTPYVPRPNPYLQPKYVYLNGKVVYNPNQNQPLQQQQQQYQQRTAPVQQVYQKPQQQLALKLAPPPISPVSYQNYVQKETVPIKPILPPKKIEVKEEVVEEQPAEEEEEEELDGDEKENLEDEEENEERYYVEDDDDENEGYKTYSFDEDDEDNSKYRESDDEDEDESKSSSTTYKNYNKSPKKHKYSTSYKYKEGYKTKTNSKSSPNKKKRQQQQQQETYKKGSKPKIEVIQGKPSAHIPVTVQKVYREKWYITRNTDRN